MSSIFASRAAARRAGAAVCAALIGAAACGLAWAQRPPITIPPATVISPSPAPSPAPPPAAALPGMPPAPRALLPTAIQTLRDPQGAGIVIFGQLTGKADSALAVVSAIFAHSQAFDPTPAPLLTAADQADRAAQALFTATVHGAPVLGIAAVTLSDSGGDVSVFYDYADAFAASFPRLQQALGPGGENAGLSPLHLADGSDIGIAPGWRVTAQGKGLADLLGPQGELVSLGDTVPVYAGPTTLAGSAAQGPCCDPVAALQAVFPQLAAAAQRRGLPLQTLTAILDSTATAAPTGGQGALIFATVSVGGRPYSWLGLVEAIGGFTDPWTFRLSRIMAPQPVFAMELPALLAAWGSYSANPPGLADRLREAASAIDALQPMLQPADSGFAQYRAEGAWNELIKAVETANRPIDAAVAQNLLARLAKDTGRQWHVAPPPQR